MPGRVLIMVKTSATSAISGIISRLMGEISLVSIGHRAFWRAALRYSAEEAVPERRGPEGSKATEARRDEDGRGSSRRRMSAGG